MQRLGILFLCLINLTGCANYFASKQPLTPEEKTEQDIRMQEFLDASSPRNLNEHPKANDVLIEKFSTNKRPSTQE